MRLEEFLQQQEKTRRQLAASLNIYNNSSWNTVAKTAKLAADNTFIPPSSLFEAVSAAERIAKVPSVQAMLHESASLGTSALIFKVGNLANAGVFNSVAGLQSNISALNRVATTYPAVNGAISAALGVAGTASSLQKVNDSWKKSSLADSIAQTQLIQRNLMRGVNLTNFSSLSSFSASGLVHSNEALFAKISGNLATRSVLSRSLQTPDKFANDTLTDWFDTYEDQGKYQVHLRSFHKRKYHIIHSETVQNFSDGAHNGSNPNERNVINHSELIKLIEHVNSLPFVTIIGFAELLCLPMELHNMDPTFISECKRNIIFVLFMVYYGNSTIKDVNRLM